ncbi:hypothetical protein MRX96_026306 [Rhipicephalus microplus]
MLRHGSVHVQSKIVVGRRATETGASECRVEEEAAEELHCAFQKARASPRSLRERTLPGYPPSRDQPHHPPVWALGPQARSAFTIHLTGPVQCRQSPRERQKKKGLLRTCRPHFSMESGRGDYGRHRIGQVAARGQLDFLEAGNMRAAGDRSDINDRQPKFIWRLNGH